MMNYRNISLIVIIGLILALVISMRSCHLKNAEIETNGKQYGIMQQTMLKELNSLGQEVSTQKELVVTKDKALQKQILSNSKLKTVNSHVEIAREISISDIKIPLTQNPDTGHSDTLRTMPVPKFFTFNDKWFFIKGNTLDDGIFLSKVGFVDSIQVNYGQKKKPGFWGFMKSKDNVVEVINFNPHSNTTGLKNVTFKEEKKWYQTNAVKIGFGFVAGYGLTKL